MKNATPYCIGLLLAALTLSGCGGTSTAATNELPSAEEIQRNDDAIEDSESAFRKQQAAEAKRNR